MIYRLECGNSKELLKTLESNSIDSIITDPPYELGFMGKKWDNTGIAYDVELWTECLRVLKHGGHLLAFSGSRTYHRMAVAIEDAGFDIRDQIQWVYGSGFPKSHNISKAIDKMEGAEREVVGIDKSRWRDVNKALGTWKGKYNSYGKKCIITAPATESAKEWDGWGTALKPAHEPICVARKPLIGTVVENVLAHGTGGINVDGCRVGGNGGCAGAGAGAGARVFANGLNGTFAKPVDGLGRWPANFIHDGSEEVLQGFPDSVSTGGKTAGYGSKTSPANIAFGDRLGANAGGLGDKGSASRFFYCAKASKKDRDEGCEGMEKQKANVTGLDKGIDYRMENGQITGLKAPTKYAQNHHPTVKPTDLMQYLCRLVTPPNGTILDPFLGSGSTGKAAIYEGFKFIGFDLNSEYIDIAKARIEFAIKNKNNTLFEHE
jgi:site-specific DNA-methyltransferase (adenine-specific)